MATGVQSPGGLRNPAPGGLQEMSPGGIQGNNWRVLQGHKSADPFGSQNSSGARVAQTRGVRNVRKDAKTTGTPTYAWTLPTVPGGSTTAVGSITNGTTATSSFTPDVAGTYVFRCTITYPGSSGTVVVNFTYVSA